MSNLPTPKVASSSTPSSSSTLRQPFNALSTSPISSPTTEDVIVESPSLSSSNALARFEFEPGKGQEGTKILMVECEDDDTTRGLRGEWTVSWDGMKTVLPVRDSLVEHDMHRLYHLLPGGERVPAVVTLTLNGTKDGVETENSTRTVVWRTNPLPAIFPPELGASARASGKKGVLHTIWAKKRLQVLAREIDAEGKTNGEGIALHMAIQEQEWIKNNFGVADMPVTLSIHSTGGNSMASVMAGPQSPTCPQTPGGGRLMEKLKGLKLGTSEKDLAKPTLEPQQHFDPLSPEQMDVAVSSFGNFAALRGMPGARTIAAKSPHATEKEPPKRTMAAQLPPDRVLAQQRQSTFGNTGFSMSTMPAEEKEDDLFALPMSPRSPEMGKSPFSFGKEDTMRYLRGERA